MIFHEGYFLKQGNKDLGNGVTLSGCEVDTLAGLDKIIVVFLISGYRVVVILIEMASGAVLAFVAGSRRFVTAITYGLFIEGAFFNAGLCWAGAHFGTHKMRSLDSGCYFFYSRAVN